MEIPTTKRVNRRSEETSKSTELTLPAITTKAAKGDYIYVPAFHTMPLDLVTYVCICITIINLSQNISIFKKVMAT